MNDEEERGPVPEQVWLEILSYASLRDVLCIGAVNRECLSSSRNPSLPCRRYIVCHDEISETDCARIVKNCLELEGLRAKISQCRRQLWLKIRSSLIFPRRIEPEETVSLAQIFSLGFSSLRWLQLEMPDPANTQSLIFSLVCCPNLELLDLASVKGIESIDLISKNKDSKQVTTFQKLRALRLSGRALVSTLNIDDMVSACSHLETIVAPYSPSARRWRSHSTTQNRKLRLNSESNLFLPPVSIVCSRCGLPLFDRLDHYLLGPGTQSHIAFEIYTQTPPNNTTVRPDNSPTQFNCAHRCHSSEGLFLIAARGNFIDTRGLAFAVACGPNLAHLITLSSEHPVIINSLSNKNANDPAFNTLLDPLVRQILSAKDYPSSAIDRTRSQSHDRRC